MNILCIGEFWGFSKVRFSKSDVLGVDFRRYDAIFRIYEMLTVRIFEGRFWEILYRGYPRLRRGPGLYSAVAAG